MTLSKSRRRMLFALICVVALAPNFALLHALGVGETIGPTGSLVARPADMMCGASMCEETSCSGKSSSCRLCSTVSCYQSAPGGGTISGWCISSTPPVCHAFNAPGTDGGMMNIVGNLGLLLGGISLAMQALGGGGGGVGGGAPIAGGVGGCAQYYPVSTPSTDPCAYYVPGSGTTSPVSNSITDTNANTSSIINENSSNAVSTLISSLLGSGTSVGGNTSGVTGIGSGSIVPGTTTATATSSPNLAPGTSAQAAQSVFGSKPGYAADIQIFTGNRISLLVSNRDTGANRQMSGFMGVSASPNKPPKEIFAVLCRARPWSVGFLAMIAPPSYLDSLCTANGFSIAPLPPPAPPAPTASATAAPPPPPTPPAPPPPPTPPPPPQASPGPTKADIWASPPSVSAGSRASLFWNATGVLDCTITSSEGNFSQNSLAGYASTPPITKNTTFNILCTTPAGTVSNQVIVTVQ